MRESREHFAQNVVKIQRVIHEMNAATPDAGFEGQCPYGIEIIRKSGGRKPQSEEVSEVATDTSIPLARDIASASKCVLRVQFQWGAQTRQRRVYPPPRPSLLVRLDKCSPIDGSILTACANFQTQRNG